MGRIEGIVATIGDVTEQKKAEQALRDSEQRFRTLFEAAPDAIYLTDLEGNLIDGNKSAEHLVGIAKEELLGKSLFALGLLPVGQIPRAQTNLKANAAGKPTGPDEFTLKRSDGTCRVLETRTFPITIENRPLVLGVARDITERKLAEQQAREHQEHLLHISRLGTLGEMASGLAHELNQPLSAILSYASASLRGMESQNTDVTRMKKNLDQMVSQAKRAGEIIKRVRTFSQRRPPLLCATNANEIVREVLGLLHYDVVHKEVQVVMNLSEDLPRVFADAIQIEQALLNLVRNAIEAMETTDPRERRLTIRTSLSAPGTVKVTVSDTGVGLPPKLLSRVFDPFFTTKVDGLGIGLSITRSILELHRGQLWVEPDQERGCTFAFTLPAVPEDPTPPRANEEKKPYCKAT
jgi:PAS domain S-box-containing protein